MAAAGISYMRKSMSFLYVVERESEHYAFACLLDPRAYAVWNELTEMAPSIAAKQVIEEYGEVLISKIQLLIANQMSTHGRKTNEHAAKKKRFQRDKNSGTTRLLAEEEFCNFMDIEWDTKNLKTDGLLDWFKNSAPTYPRISSLARIVYSMTGSTMENERIFSISGSNLI
jgi:hypothetical protein